MLVRGKFKVCFFGAFWNFILTIFDPELVESADVEPWIRTADCNSTQQHTDESLKMVVGGAEGESELYHAKISIFKSWGGWNPFYSALEKGHLENTT